MDILRGKNPANCFQEVLGDRSLCVDASAFKNAGRIKYVLYLDYLLHAARKAVAPNYVVAF